MFDSKKPRKKNDLKKELLQNQNTDRRYPTREEFQDIMGTTTSAHLKTTTSTYLKDVSITNLRARFAAFMKDSKNQFAHRGG